MAARPIKKFFIAAIMAAIQIFFFPLIVGSWLMAVLLGLAPCRSLRWGGGGARASPEASPPRSPVGGARIVARLVWLARLSSAAARARASGLPSPLNAHRSCCACPCSLALPPVADTLRYASGVGHGLRDSVASAAAVITGGGRARVGVACRP